MPKVVRLRKIEPLRLPVEQAIFQAGEVDEANSPLLHDLPP